MRGDPNQVVWCHSALGRFIDFDHQIPSWHLPSGDPANGWTCGADLLPELGHL